MPIFNLENKKLKTLEFHSIPEETTDLDLSNNEFTQIPEELGDLPNLSYVNLDDNNITRLDVNIEKLQNLSLLSIGNNNINYISENIGKLKKLQSLYIFNTPLQFLPNSIVELEYLEGLFLADNQLTHLPENIGKLKSLEKLNLQGNQLERLPESIKELTNLTHLDLSGNKLPLPENYTRDFPPKQVIAYVLRKQASLQPKISIKVNDIYIFRNIGSKIAFQQEYKTNVNNALSEYNLNIHEINNIKSLNKVKSVVFIIAPYDSHENENLIHEVILSCQKQNLKYIILIPELSTVYGELINLERASLIATQIKKIAFENKDNVFFFKSIPDLTNKIINALEHLSPQIILKKLVLQNIGHFENTSISFDKDVTCLVGENGAGKTTLLRALGLGIIGSKNKDIDLLKVENMLRVKSWHTGKMNFAADGFIELHYSIDNKPKTQRIVFKNNGVIEIKDDGNFETLLNHLDLKTLVIGFPQIRNSKTAPSRQVRTHPNIADIIPLINNIDDERLESFSNWLVNLFGAGQNKINEGNGLVNETDVEELILIEKIFTIISKLTKHPIKFKTVGKFAPPQIIVTTFDSQEGIPLDLLSQGFKVLIGWIGHFLQRLAEAYPMNKHSFEQENAIVIVDEIDSYIHPIWQQGFLQTLREIFPKTQFIVSTHSPLLVAGLDRNQIVELEYSNETRSIEVLESQVDTWAMSYADILLKLFNTMDPLPVKTIEDLQHQLKELGDSNKEEKAILLENIERLKESAAYKDNLEKYRQQLEEREKELDRLMQKLKAKLQELN